MRNSAKPKQPYGMTARQLDVQRIAVNKQGYDRSGACWGAGPDVFIFRIARLRHDATTADGGEEVTARARTMTEARSKVDAELARRPGEARAGKRDHIGGASPHKSRYEIDWRNPVTNETVRIRITHARDYLSSGSDHIEVESITPKKAPLPITETGYRSHFLAPLELINAGGPVTFVTAWIEQEAKGKAWYKAAAAKAQGDLFSWPDAEGEVAQRKRVAQPKKPAAKATRTRGRARALE